MLKFRFSIRSMLAFTMLAALLAWWLATPTATTARFVKAINSKQYFQAADMFLVDGSNDMLQHTKKIIVEAHVVTPPLTLSDLLRGRRSIHLTIVYDQPDRTVTGFFPLEADLRGIHSLNQRPYEDADFRFQ